MLVEVSFIHVGTFAIAMSVRYPLKVTPLLLLFRGKY